MFTRITIDADDLSLLTHALGDDHPIVQRARHARDAFGDPLLAPYRAAAHHSACSAELEIDAQAIVSKSDDGGAYVEAWLWVSDEEAGLEDPASDA